MADIYGRHFCCCNTGFGGMNPRHGKTVNTTKAFLERASVKVSTEIGPIVSSDMRPGDVCVMYYEQKIHLLCGASCVDPVDPTATSFNWSSPCFCKCNGSGTIQKVRGVFERVEFASVWNRSARGEKWILIPLVFECFGSIHAKRMGVSRRSGSPAFQKQPFLRLHEHPEPNSCGLLTSERRSPISCQLLDF
jgi:hypothetical protein